MQKYEENVSARINGNNLQPLQGASITVTSLDTGLPASLYSDNGVTPLAQPLVTDNTGYFGFYAPDGKYKLTFSGTRFATFTREIVLEDPADNPYATKADLAAGTGAALVTFTQVGAGSAAIDLQTLLRESISVTSYGAGAGAASGFSAALQRAVDSLGGKPGTIHIPRGTYKPDGKVSCFAGQNIIGDGAVLDVSGYDGVFLSYNEADVFSLTDPLQGAFHPPTLIQGFKVMGKVSVVAPNRNFVFAKINRTPFVTMRDLALYYAAAAQIIDESILCTFDSVRCYNPVSDCLWFNCTDRVNRFAPNGCNVVNCWFEEQKYPCNGVRISAGNINITGGYLESLSTLVKFDGGIGTLTGVALGLRYQAGSKGIEITQPTTLTMIGCGITFGGGLNASSMTALSIGAATNLTFNDNLITAIHGNSENSTCFAVNADVIGTMNGNTFISQVLGGKTTIFDIGNNASYAYRGTCEGNHWEAKAGCGMDFNKANGGAGKLATDIQGRFVRVGSFAQLATSVIQNSVFDGAGSALSFNGGILRNNVFQSSGWSVTGAAMEEGNFGLYSLGKQSKPIASAYLGATTSIPDSTYTKIVCGIEEYDTNDAYDATTGKFQPTVPGYYDISALVAWYPSATGTTQAYLYKNGARYMPGTNNPVDTNGMAQLISGKVAMNGSTDYLELYGRQTSGAALNVAGGVGMLGTYFQATFIRGL